MKRRTLVSTIILIAVILVSLFAINEWFSSHQSTSEFFVGVEFAYGDASDLKDLVDKVKNYTNLFVIGALEISFNQTALNKTCDYIVDAGLHFIVLFTDSTKYSYSIFDWMIDAKQKYGDMFLGVYRFDEPGGKQLDHASAIVNSSMITSSTSYTEVAAIFTGYWKLHIDYYLNYSQRLFTADYGLYWFDFKAGYTTVFAEFGWNFSRQLHIALCRGAARAQNQTWGAIVTWTYTDAPNIETGTQLYDDLILAYDAGAKYAVVFSYPTIEGRYGILAEEHFDALQSCWKHIQSNRPNLVVDEEVKTAYVLPRDYGFGFRRPDDTIWGLWPADELSAKVWNDANTLADRYGASFDIVYDEPEFAHAIKNRYKRLIFWNETVT